MNIIADHLQESSKVKLQVSVAPIEYLAGRILYVLKQGGKLLIFGNGGSAADAQHFAAELVVKYKKPRKGLPAIALTVDSSVLTAIGNDFDFVRIFSRQVESLAKPGDLVIGISTSGTSPNVLAGLREAKSQGATTALMTGRFSDINVDHLITVPSEETSHIQEAHIAIIHAICAYVDSCIL